MHMHNIRATSTSTARAPAASTSPTSPTTTVATVHVAGRTSAPEGYINII